MTGLFFINANGGTFASHHQLCQTVGYSKKSWTGGYVTNVINLFAYFFFVLYKCWGLLFYHSVEILRMSISCLSFLESCPTELLTFKVSLCGTVIQLVGHVKLPSYQVSIIIGWYGVLIAVVVRYKYQVYRSHWSSLALVVLDGFP
ncbi:hypothetical protein BDC45DRAFT_562554 [Circinella umbellata]|nr:hypothetical protein BDC45DRAFT_562554 [Circinella umbellata]